MDSDTNKSKLNVAGWQPMEQNIFQHMGLRYCLEDDGTCRTWAPLNEKTGNHVKTFHAAFQFALAESIGGIVVFDNRDNEAWVPLVKSVTMDFKKPATTDLVATTRFSPQNAAAMNQAMAESGRYNFTLDIDIQDMDDNTVSVMHAVYAVRKLT